MDDVFKNSNNFLFEVSASAVRILCKIIYISKNLVKIKKDVSYEHELLSFMIDEFDEKIT
ncbi:hypothetical protein CWI37_0001p0010 [Hamiltosporidium tvaerminnensis]|uniref:Uncharacterized protein n=1 Tax=Hamiltosporidium tvaerminnensis TaxID=1176355 RepID=A0A4Q9LEN8_9MICR|nr:hypothetical protein CWI37_0001p0010 [Hamiltosporidium tvaerminnensis]